MQLTVGFYKPILWRTAAVVLPSAALLGGGRLSLSSWYFYGSLFLILLVDMVRQAPGRRGRDHRVLSDDDPAAGGSLLQRTGDHLRAGAGAGAHGGSAAPVPQPVGGRSDRGRGGVLAGFGHLQWPLLFEFPRDRTGVCGIAVLSAGFASRLSAAGSPWAGLFHHCGGLRAACERRGGE